MSFSRILLLFSVVFLLPACVTTPEKTTSSKSKLVVAPEITDYSDYAELGLLIVDQEYKHRLSATVSLLADTGKKNTDNIMAQLDTLIQDRPDLTIARYNKALLYAEQGRFDQAQSLFREAHEIDPINDRICNAYGRLMRTQGQFKQAETLYASCLSYEGQSAVVYKNYGILLDLYLQQPERALEQYQTYLSMTGQKDRKVKGWVLDLKRRLKVGSTQ